jgi:hypothetical protein
MAQRVAAARAAGITTMYAPPADGESIDGVGLLPVRHVGEAISWVTGAR